MILLVAGWQACSCTHVAVSHVCFRRQSADKSTIIYVRFKGIRCVFFCHVPLSVSFTERSSQLVKSYFFCLFETRSLYKQCLETTRQRCLSYEQDRQCTYKRNTDARSRNHCYHRKAMCYLFHCACAGVPERVGVCICVHACSLTCSACTAHAPCYIVICHLFVSTIFLYIIS
jgi:hypothetical protein